ncbi:uracil-DNA glycosylase [Listeria welshimeri]|uniref:uracil-DNA glycosylase n=1 Tax=Listeria welshimeri TaxID=1643 RepID=UPI0018886AD5|nr:uracil-DNA glycosylase [Listeria welshimeri]MBF2341145.1 uracil-DNA glycosylase [Listeria welshimeri]MBF2461201.1 uracil-DNA glycosylase [Listeria welshimeri]
MMKNWDEFLKEEAKQPYFIKLMEEVAEARTKGNVYPTEEDMFSCFRLCPYDKVKVVILGQDPYHGAGQAHGLSFSVQKGVKIPPSLRNIYKELQTDLEIEPADHGYLAKWAEQGVLLMNTSWSVEEGKAGSHKKLGWATFTNHVLDELNNYDKALVFILWGNHAIKAASGIDNPKHLLIKGVHPSPLAARGGFFGSKPFSETNAFLKQNGRTPIDWDLNSK